MDLYLIRHPTPLIDQGVCYGQSDVPVSPEVLEKTAERLRSLLPLSLVIFASPLSRCRLLAERLGGPVRLDDRLKERDFGQWELSTWDEIGPDPVDEWVCDPVDFAPPGGESARQVRRRVDRFFRELTRGSQASCAIVAHGGPLSLLTARILGVPLARAMDLAFECGATSRLVVTPGRGRLAFFNRF